MRIRTRCRLAIAVVALSIVPASVLGADGASRVELQSGQLEIRTHQVEAGNNWGGSYSFTLSVLGASRDGTFLPLLAIALEPDSADRWLAVWNLGSDGAGWTRHLRALVPNYWSPSSGIPPRPDDIDDFDLPEPDLTAARPMSGSRQRLVRWAARLSAGIAGLMSPARFALQSYTDFRDDLDDRRFYQLYTKIRLYEDVSRLAPSPDHLSIVGLHDLLYRLIVNRHRFGVLMGDEPIHDAVMKFENERRTHMGQVASFLQSQATLYHLGYEEVRFGLPGRPPVSYAAMLYIRGADLPADPPAWPSRNPFDLSYNPYTHAEIQELVAEDPEATIPLAFYVLPSQFNLKPVIVADFFGPANVTVREMTGALRLGLEHYLAISEVPRLYRVMARSGTYVMGRSDVSQFSNRSTVAGVESVRILAGIDAGELPDALDLRIETALERRVANPLAMSFQRESAIADLQYQRLTTGARTDLAMVLRRLHENEMRAELGLGNKAILEEDYEAFLEARAYQDALRAVRRFNRAAHVNPYDWDTLLAAWRTVVQHDAGRASPDAERFVERLGALFPGAVPERHHPQVLQILGRPALQAQVERPRLIVIKVDGLSDLVLRAAVDPAGAEARALPSPEQFRLAHREVRTLLGRQVLLPNLTRYFFEEGARPEAMYVGTAPLSTPSWAAIDTGQRSIIKNQFLFNRATGTVSRYLDQVYETGRLLRGAGRTSAVWSLDMAGVPSLLDAFAKDRRWTSIQFIVREAPVEQLKELGRHFATGGTGSRNPITLFPVHLRRTVYFPDGPEQSDRALAGLAAKVVGREDAEGNERYDLISVIFPTLDHQFHVNAEYTNLLTWMVKLDEWVGTLFAAIEASERRDATLVALVSDHGANFDPMNVNYAFPITSWFRKASWGGHTNFSAGVENQPQDWLVPMRGLEFASRIYESDDSPYGPRVPHGEKGYYTAFLDNEGNPRFDAFLRHSDLNRLHLLLLEVLRLRDEPARLAHVYPEFQATLAVLNRWLPQELERMQMQVAAFTAYRESLLEQDTRQTRDEARRFKQEIERGGAIVAALARVLSIPTEQTSWMRWASNGFRMTDLIPKGYLGIRNDVRALHGYVAGWVEPPEARWLTGPATYRRVNYPSLISEFRASNPSAYGTYEPFDLFAAPLPLDEIEIEGTMLPPLRQAIWLRFSRGRGQAVLFESEDGFVQYMPIRPLALPDEGIIRLEPSPDEDPLAFGPLRFAWLTRHEWAAHVGHEQRGVVPVLLTELFRDSYRDFLTNPAYQERIAGAADVDPGRHAAAVEQWFGQLEPDFRVWTHDGWNVNTRSHTPGGAHGGFDPLETRIIFALWGGARFELPRGEVVPGAYLSHDITPTLLHLLGMLDERGRVVRADGAVDVDFPPFAGQVMSFSTDPVVTVSAP